ncbi:redoxin domain-containing protein, partial [Candidatus Saccharibacteria bacterium]|nr:redoxin domain-containing protein [Candidatus Saccharibacteria bacterium]
MNTGDKAKAFALADHEGRIVHLSDFAGAWLVLYFYPKDD